MDWWQPYDHIWALSTLWFAETHRRDIDTSFASHVKQASSVDYIYEIYISYGLLERKTRPFRIHTVCSLSVSLFFVIAEKFMQEALEAALHADKKVRSRALRYTYALRPTVQYYS